MQNLLVNPKEMMFHFERDSVEQYFKEIGTIPFEHNYPHFKFTKNKTTYYCCMVSENGLHCYYYHNGTTNRKSRGILLPFSILSTPQFEKLIKHINDYAKWEY